MWEFIDGKEIEKLGRLGGNVIKKVGLKYKMPIIDLTRTFDPLNREHYGSTAIEPSILGG